MLNLFCIFADDIEDYHRPDWRKERIPKSYMSRIN